MIKFDGELEIAIGKSRKETSWKNTGTTWSALVEKLSQTHRTHETVKEYYGAAKDRQDEIKDIGGFVAGHINGGRRLKGSIGYRTALTLDLDFAKPGFWDLFTLMYDCAALVYSTHKHKSDNPRLRLVVPLNRQVFPDEYEAIARKFGEALDLNTFDDTTFEPSRLMYWPSTSVDGEYEFHSQDGEWLDADEVLAQYKDWHDYSQWPTSSRVSERINSDIKKQGDPLEKTGLIGAFCREYSITEALDTFLADTYVQVSNTDARYTYVLGSTAGGLVTYEDKFAFSHHGTDPISGLCVNAWDLIRMHMFGEKDLKAKADMPPSKLPSFSAMEEFASTDARVRKRLVQERLEEAQAKFGDIEFDEEEPIIGNTETEYSDEWQSELEADKKGVPLVSINNAVLILRNDKYLRKTFALNKFEKREIATRSLPWRKVTKENRYLTDSDDVSVRHYIETRYKLTSKQAIQDGMVMIAEENSFHPIKDYLDSLKWDGKPRLESLFIDYFGAEDCPYTRAVAVKMCTAAVARIKNPGCKFDYVVTFVGAQGLYKSSFAAALGKEWYSDSFGTIQGKEAYESIQGVWIVEMAELSGLKKSDREQVKHFISKRDDRFRVAYGRRTENFPRQCIFIGSTNEDDFLDDPTGNRRFWPVRCQFTQPTKNVVKDLVDEEVDQIWAEAIDRYDKGETLYLPKEIEEAAWAKQKDHAFIDERTSLVINYLGRRYPAEWKKLSDWEKIEYVQKGDFEKGILLDKVSVSDIWTECFGKNIAELNMFSSKEIRRIMSGFKDWESKVIKDGNASVRGYYRK